MPWFRMYVDFLNDPKLIALAFEDQRHFIGVLALKSDGALDGDVNPTLLDRIVAQRLWIDHAIIRDVKKRLVEADLINEDWQPKAWQKRQFKSDSSAERVRKHRESKNKKSGNNDETLQKQKSNAIDTDTDTDTDTEKKKTTPKFKLPEDIDPVRWSEWLKVRAKKKSATSDYAYSLLVKRLRECEKLGYSANEVIDIAITRSWASIELDWLTPKPSAKAAADGWGGARI